mgnify:CR=1 FL=1
MKAILSYAPQCGIELLTPKNGELYLRKDSWLMMLIEKKYNGETIKYLGRDNIGRVEIEMNVMLFKKLQNDPLFIMKSENLRRLRTSRLSILDYLMTREVNLIDNDLDN